MNRTTERAQVSVTPVIQNLGLASLSLAPLAHLDIMDAHLEMKRTYVGRYPFLQFVDA